MSIERKWLRTAALRLEAGPKLSVTHTTLAPGVSSFDELEVNSPTATSHFSVGRSVRSEHLSGPFDQRRQCAPRCANFLQCPGAVQPRRAWVTTTSSQRLVTQQFDPRVIDRVSARRRLELVAADRASR